MSALRAITACWVSQRLELWRYRFGHDRLGEIAGNHGQ
jgi:hypothetical protein